MLEQFVKKIEENSDLLYQEIKTANEENKLEQIKEKNNILQNNLRRVISNLHITYSEILNQINIAKSVQTNLSRGIVTLVQYSWLNLKRLEPFLGKI